MLLIFLCHSEPTGNDPSVEESITADVEITTEVFISSVAEDPSTMVGMTIRNVSY